VRTLFPVVAAQTFSGSMPDMGCQLRHRRDDSCAITPPLRGPRADYDTIEVPEFVRTSYDARA
jgi:hypothetical protein